MDPRRSILCFNELGINISKKVLTILLILMNLIFDFKKEESITIPLPLIFRSHYSYYFPINFSTSVQFTTFQNALA